MMASASAMALMLSPPGALDLWGNIAENWKMFAQQFNLTLTASDNDDIQKTSLLLPGFILARVVRVKNEKGRKFTRKK